MPDMTTKTLGKPTRSLKREIELLRSFVIGYLGRDSEGEYNPKFVKEMLKETSDNKSEYVFKNKKSLLSYLNGGNKN